MGANNTLTFDEPGRLFLGMNAGEKPACTGDIAVKLQLTSAPVGAQIESKLWRAAQTWVVGQFGTGTPHIAPTLKVSGAPLDSQLANDLDGMPRRVTDQFKNLGDMTNFVIIGSQQKLQAALGAAHCRSVDPGRGSECDSTKRPI